jgi:hypothetical protein
VDDPLFVSGTHRVGQGDSDPEQLGDRHPFSGNQLGECLALDQLHGDEVDTVVLLDREDGDDVRMIECRHRLRFGFKPREPPSVLGYSFRQHLDCDISIELLIVSAIDLAHASFTQLGEDAVVGKGGADHCQSVGARRFNSSNQSRVTWSWVTGSTVWWPGFTIMNLCPSGDMS